MAELEKAYKRIDEGQEEEEIEEPEEKYPADEKLPEEDAESQEISEKMLLEQEVNDEESDIPDFVASIPVEGSTDGRMILELRYGEGKKRHDELEAEIKSPHFEMTGYIDLYAKDIEGNLNMDELKVTLHFPKAYINPETIKFLKFNDQTSPADNWEISNVEEKDEYYEISITFKGYKQTGQTKTKRETGLGLSISQAICGKPQ